MTCIFSVVANFGVVVLSGQGVSGGGRELCAFNKFSRKKCNQNGDVGQGLANAK